MSRSETISQTDMRRRHGVRAAAQAQGLRASGDTALMGLGLGLLLLAVAGRLIGG